MADRMLPGPSASSSLVKIRRCTPSSRCLRAAAPISRAPLAAAARRHRPFGPSRLIFTKLDEADGPGSILSAIAALPRQVSCATNGQRVPDDLQIAGGPFLVDQVVGAFRSKDTAWIKQTA